MAYGAQQYGGSRYGYSAALNFARTYTEGLQLDETNIFTASLIFSENTGFSGNYQDQADLFRLYTEQTAYPHTYSRSADYFRTHQESAEMAETFSRTIETYRSYNENLGVQGTLQDIYIIVYRTLTESMSLNEFYGPITVSIARSEAVGFNDSYSRTADFGRNYNEILRLRGSTDLRPELFIQEKIAMDDTYSRISDLQRLYNEDLAVQSQFVEKTVSKVLQEQSSFSENYTSESELFRSFSETFFTDESFSRVGEYYRNYDEISAFQHSYSRTADYGRKYPESIAVLDTVNTIADLERLYNEDLAISESFVRTIQAFRTVEEIVGVDESRTFDIAVALSEEIMLDSSFSAATTFRRQYDERLSVEDFSALFDVIRAAEEVTIDTEAFEEYDISTDIFEQHNIASEIFEQVTMESDID